MIQYVIFSPKLLSFGLDLDITFSLARDEGWECGRGERGEERGKRKEERGKRSSGNWSRRRLSRCDGDRGVAQLYTWRRSVAKVKRGREKAFLGVADSGRVVAEWQRSGRANVEVAVPGARRGKKAKMQKGKKAKRQKGWNVTVTSLH